MSNILDAIFRPQSVAVIGASRRHGSIGREIVHAIIEYGFNGMVFPVNPKAKVIHSIKCYRSVLEIPDEVDMAVIVVPKPLVNQALIDCGRKEVKGIVMITAGYSEVGNKADELEVKQLIEQYNMRLVGPNCMGIINTHSDYQLNATFASTPPIKGNVGFVSQSGALGVAILDSARDLNIGFSMFASVGNKTDVSANDLLEYWEDDEETEIILLYLESFGNPRNFTKLARRIVRKKPIIAVKSGRTALGAKAASSHTGALAGMDMATDALFNQAGVIRVNSVEEMFDLTQAFAKQPLPKGDRVAVMTNAGGPGILVTDALVCHNMEMADFSEQTIKTLQEYLPPEASFSNPLDMIASADPPGYKRTLDILMKDPLNDAVIVIFVPPVTVDAEAIARSIAEVASKGWDKPIICCFMGTRGERSGVPILRQAKLPVYLYPEAAAMALAAMVQYRQISQRPEGKIVTYDDVDKEKVESVINIAIEHKRERLNAEEIGRILKAYRFPLPDSIITKEIDEALEFSRSRYPIVLKMMAESVVHKTDVGGVMVDIRNDDELRAAFGGMTEKADKLELTDYSILVQQMVKGGRETIIGMTQDPTFGPLIMFGLGGIYVEIMKDVNFAIHPITDLEAERMVKTLKGRKLLEGIRGEKAVDYEIIIECLLRLSQLVADFHQIKEMDLNPFLAFPEKKKSRVVDARLSIKLDGSVKV
ncbi:MAG: acetate--CoA ligase family protein [candidate division Zixibacteria bacterium]|nr:acetate--CoA ligase family protein [Candidatus Tariuqbacter arcticus]